MKLFEIGIGFVLLGFSCFFWIIGKTYNHPAILLFLAGVIFAYALINFYEGFTPLAINNQSDGGKQ